MANLYVRSTDGSDADNGSTWALAKATISGASAIDAAGDRVYVSQAHAESVASSSNAWAGTNANPVLVLGGDDSAEPPTSLSTAPSITVTGGTFSWTGSVYTYGIDFLFSSGSSIAPAFNGTSAFCQVFDSCSLWLTGAGGSSSLTFGSASSSAHNQTDFRNCTFRVGGAGQTIAIYRDSTISGGSWASGGTNPNGTFSIGSSGRPARLLVEGFDFSNLSTTFNIIQAISEGGCKATIRNSKLPASWAGSLVASGQLKLGSRVEMHNCDSTDTNYRLWVEDYSGSIKSETTIVRSGGASDGTAPFSWKMVSSANVGYPASVLVSPELPARWNTTTGSAITVTIEVITDGVTLTDAECWLEVQYLGTSGFPVSLFASDAKATALATAANQTTSTETWTTTGLGSPTKQKLAVTFTPQEAGYLQGVVKLAKASATIYVCPKMTVS